MPFSTPLITPSEYHHATTTATTPQSDPNSHLPRIIPIAAYLPSLHASFSAAHLPNTRFLPLHKTYSSTSPYPCTLPTLSHFCSIMTALAIRPTDTLVIYDAVSIGTYHAPRVAFMCQFFGHRGDVHVLNNLRGYVGEGFPVSGYEMGGKEGEEYILPASGVDYARVVEFEEVRDIILQRQRQRQKQKERDTDGDGSGSGAGAGDAAGDAAGKVCIIDARIPGRFSGTESEADPSLRAGHMPGAVNVPLARVLDPVSGAILSVGELRGVLAAVGILVRDYILTCNSGVTAAALDLVLRLVGAKGRRRIYDGSWMEWTRRVGEGEGLIVHA
ncbi:Rhodanese-like protein [Aspergillus heteromorphus CBS 117.55]|uniref:Rhodanese-like protein n=1 Tax=Aspergillus heteromorphus CBS 117.55 TaxID=1448321 RepID=A0A317VXK2_9EURO|nr:Rhodanese-like protein [Aspergillus heteromorphus CBS 117.55]PWY79166.1 Rhodanese-like protein [Aspergillus heteromorphus CBS 117.55]